MTLNLQHLEELYKNATQGEWIIKDYSKYDSKMNQEITLADLADSERIIGGHSERPGVMSVEDAELIVALHNALPKILKTIRAYEEMVENVRGMYVQGIDCEFWGCEPLRTAIEARRDSILKYLDEKLKEVVEGMN